MKHSLTCLGSYTLFLMMLTGPYALSSQMPSTAPSSTVVKTESGMVEGTVSADGMVRTFKGIPYAAPPVGPLRWREPQPLAAWTGIRKAIDFGPRCMQTRVFDDMIFPDQGPSEDCLSLNLWMPAAPAEKPLPVMVWIYGGGFVAGSSSEPRQDGGNLCMKGVLVVSFNYRLGIFGFFSHPELTKESGRGASGNYGLMDQVAALRWVRKNIAAFGGDPGNVTIFGESAGSFSVSALMASPLAKGLFNRAIGESGAFFSSTLGLRPLAASEKSNLEFAKTSLAAESIEALRAKPAEEILKAVPKEQTFRFGPNIDGYFLPEEVYTIFAAGKQAQVPLLAGWNADEGGFQAFFGKDAPTAQNYAARARTRFGANTEAFLKLYPGETDAQARRSAQDLSGDQFIAYSTWKWMDLHQKTCNSRIYRYRFEQTLPPDPTQPRAEGVEPTAPHASEIEFVFGMLSSRKLPWRDEDRNVSDLMGSYWANFARSGDPNGPGLPVWPSYRAADGFQVMHLSAESRALGDRHRERYEFLEKLNPHR